MTAVHPLTRILYQASAVVGGAGLSGLVFSELPNPFGYILAFTVAFLTGVIFQALEEWRR